MTNQLVSTSNTLRLERDLSGVPTAKSGGTNGAAERASSFDSALRSAADRDSRRSDLAAESRRDQDADANRADAKRADSNRADAKRADSQNAASRNADAKRAERQAAGRKMARRRSEADARTADDAASAADANEASATGSNSRSNASGSANEAETASSRNEADGVEEQTVGTEQIRESDVAGQALTEGSLDLASLAVAADAALDQTTVVDRTNTADDALLVDLTESLTGMAEGGAAQGALSEELASASDVGQSAQQLAAALALSGSADIPAEGDESDLEMASVSDLTASSTAGSTVGPTAQQDMAADTSGSDTDANLGDQAQSMEGSDSSAESQTLSVASANETSGDEASGDAASANEASEDAMLGSDVSGLVSQGTIAVTQDPTAAAGISAIGMDPVLDVTSSATTQVESTNLSAAEAAELAQAEADAPGGDAVFRQVQRAIGAISGIGEGDHEFKIRLTPQELGSVTIDIKSSEAGIAIGVVTETSAASDRLNEQRDQLLQELANGGLDSSSVDISHGGQDFGSLLQGGQNEQSNASTGSGSGVGNGQDADRSTARAVPLRNTVLGVNRASTADRVDISL